VYLLDTDTVIDLLHYSGNVGQRLSQIAPREVAIAAMTLAELRFGALNSTDVRRNLNELDRFLVRIETLPFDAQCAGIHAELRFAMRSQAIGQHDLIIAACALASERTLVSSNLREFGRVPGLQVESWR